MSRVGKGTLIIPSGFAEILVIGVLAGSVLAGCEVPADSSVVQSRNPGEGVTNCISAGYGNETPFCHISFDEALSQVRTGEGEQFQVRAVLSLEFGRCILHRDEFAAVNYLDAESIWLDQPHCEEDAVDILAGQQTAVVNVRGRLVSGDLDDVRRAGGMREIVELERSVEPRR